MKAIILALLLSGLTFLSCEGDTPFIYIPEPIPCEVTDLNGDGETGEKDLVMLLASLGICPEGFIVDGDSCRADFNLDGFVDDDDLEILQNNWGEC